MTEEKVLLNAALCFLVRDGNVLLAKKTKKIGAGCWNGYGGGIEEGETPREAAARELFEEAGVKTDPESMEKIAMVDFHNTTSEGKKFSCQVHVYLTRQWTGEPYASEEMTTPTWFPTNRLPFDEMMPADKVWLLRALHGRKIIASAHLGPFQKELLKPVEFRDVDEFPEEK